MDIVLRSPGMYVQKAGVASSIERYVEMLGKKPLFVSTKGSFERYGNTIFLNSDNLKHCESVIIGSETTIAEINKIVEAYNSFNNDLVVGFGGGKAIDNARAAADILSCPLIIIPTVASNDAPCSALSVIHNDSGAVTELRITKRNPDVVLVDTDIIISAPERLFVAGIGDALATYFEAVACSKSGAATLAGATSSDVALVLSKLCYDTLIQYGVSALHAVRAGIANDAFDKVIQASIYLSGIGFESGGVAAAHAINDGFSACSEASHLYHGEIVGFGTLCMLMLEGADGETVNTVLDFMCDVGLPVTFKQLGIDITDELLLRIADVACNKSVMNNMPFKVTPADVIRAMLKADLVGQSKFCAEKE